MQPELLSAVNDIFNLFYPISCGCSSSFFQSFEFYGLLQILSRARKNNWKCTSAQSSSSPSPDPSLPFQTRTSSRATFGLYFKPDFAVAALKEPSPPLSLSASFQTLTAAINSSSFSTSSTSFSSLEKKRRKRKSSLQELKDRNPRRYSIYCSRISFFSSCGSSGKEAIRLLHCI